MSKLRLAVRILLALLFLATGSVKLLGVPMMVAEFATIGHGQGFRYITGICEIGGAILLLIPRTIPIGAMVLTAVSIGALIVQLAVLHGDPIHPVVLAALLIWTGWSSRNTLRPAL